MSIAQLQVERDSKNLWMRIHGGDVSRLGALADCMGSHNAGDDPKGRTSFPPPSPDDGRTRWEDPVPIVAEMMDE
jgi:hypothetical protein